MIHKNSTCLEKSAFTFEKKDGFVFLFKRVD